MNTAPILGLAKEQIASQLLWSHKCSDGNVMTAQEWLSGENFRARMVWKKANFDIFNPSAPVTATNNDSS